MPVSENTSVREYKDNMTIVMIPCQVHMEGQKHK